LKPRCFDPSVPQDDPVFHWWRCIRTAAIDFGKPVDYPEDCERLLEQAGLGIQKHNRIDIRTSQDRTLEQWTQENQLTRFHRFTLFHPPFKTIKGLSMGLFTHQLRWTPEQVAALCADVVYILNRSDSPWFHKLWVSHSGTLTECVTDECFSHVVTARREVM